jgi:hypothetical protein
MIKFVWNLPIRHSRFTFGASQLRGRRFARQIRSQSGAKRQT